jgi:hypothetical protein
VAAATAAKETQLTPFNREMGMWLLLSALLRNASGNFVQQLLILQLASEIGQGDDTIELALIVLHKHAANALLAHQVDQISNLLVLLH